MKYESYCFCNGAGFAAKVADYAIEESERCCMKSDF